MRTNSNIIKMVEAIRRGAPAETATGGVDGICMADVMSVEPLAIRMHDRSINNNIYINPALMVEASDSGEKMEKVFQDPFETQEAYGFLKEFHEKYVLKKGDTVVVCMTGSSFYIVGKAVRI
ncbi:MAG: hypothetical protein NC331_16590 [Lachnospiraceae bacterium]|nr:hypothetical protein [Lachnospiraceae bacterium]MCM1240969.1 hypothetical protein [Lachnospiraceae bacterium]